MSKSVCAANEGIIALYVQRSSELQFKIENGQIGIQQLTDGKFICFDASMIEEVIEREDASGTPFLQINFIDNKKILITDKLIGFKPVPYTGVDLDKLPKVVTTPDLISVLEAIDDTVAKNQFHPTEVEILKKVFNSILLGAEAVGFEMAAEKLWLKSYFVAMQAS